MNAGKNISNKPGPRRSLSAILRYCSMVYFHLYVQMCYILVHSLVLIHLWGEHNRSMAANALHTLLQQDGAVAEKPKLNVEWNRVLQYISENEIENNNGGECYFERCILYIGQVKCYRSL
jgi:hypothetical protein